MRSMWMTPRQLQSLIDCEIVEVRGISGVPTNVGMAVEAPMLVQVHAMSGKVFDLEYNQYLDQLKLTEVA